MPGKVAEDPLFFLMSSMCLKLLEGYMDPFWYMDPFLLFKCIIRLGIFLSHLEGRQCSRGFALDRENWWCQWKRVFPYHCHNAAALLLMFLELAMHVDTFL